MREIKYECGNPSAVFICFFFIQKLVATIRSYNSSVRVLLSNLTGGDMHSPHVVEK